MTSGIRRARPISAAGDGAAVPGRLSKRYTKLTAALHKALDASRDGIDTRAAVAECFGADASIFAGSSAGSSGSCDGEGADDGATDMLANLIGDVIECANERLRSDFESILEKEGVGPKLLTFDHLVEEDLREERERAEAEEEDISSAREAALSSRLPVGVSAEDFLTYQAHRIKLEERDRLIAEIESIEKQNENNQLLIDKGRGLIKERVSDIDMKGKEIERTAEVGSFNRIGLVCHVDINAKVI